MIIDNWDYQIGTGNGQHAAGQSITDSLIGIGVIAAVACGNQYFTAGFTVTGNYLFFGNVLTTSNDDVVQIIFRHPLEIITNA